MGHRILVIEDNPANLELVLFLLEAFGHEGTPAHNGRVGLSRARSELPHLILLDLQMPDMDGFAVLRELRKDPTTQQIPVVAVTALAMPGDRERVRRAGFDGYISKPIEPELFLVQLEPFLGRSETTRQEAAVPGAPVDAAPTAPGATPARHRLLAVDDIAVNIDLLRASLEASGYSVIGCSRVTDALALVKRDWPDVIITDLHLPDRDGLSLLAELKGDPQTSHIPIVVYTSSSRGERDEEEAMALGAAAYWRRPVEPAALLAKLDDLLDDLSKEK